MTQLGTKVAKYLEEEKNLKNEQMTINWGTHRVFMDRSPPSSLWEAEIPRAQSSLRIASTSSLAPALSLAILKKSLHPKARILSQDPIHDAFWVIPE